MAQQRGPRPASQRGDFTGNQKDKLQQEHAAALEERRDELGLITQGQKAVKDEGVIDLTKNPGTPQLEHPDLEDDDEVVVTTDEAGTPTPARPEQPAPATGTRLDGGGRSTIEVYELPQEEMRAAVSRGEVMDQDTLNEPVLIRSLYDLEDVTIGYGNTYNLKEGYRYRVPRWVAIHLEEKDLCIVLSLTAA